ncbi:xaa-Pro aminopeptidase-like protein I [Halenospora varia]|nr:xaa-Pro aminopeptidase-like protein I [Halenospora varia]
MSSPKPAEADAQAEFDLVNEAEHDAVVVTLRPKPKEKYPAKLHARKVLQNLNEASGLIYLPGTPSLYYEDSDQEIFFRQRRYFYYLTGLNFPDCAVTYDIKRDKLIVWIPPQNTGRTVIYNGFNPTKEEIAAIADFSDIRDITDLDDYIIRFIDYGRKIYVLHKNQQPTFPNHQSIPPNTESAYDSSALIKAMDAARVIKSPYEIKAIRKANAITTQAHVNVLRGLHNFENEAEIEAVFLATCVSEQAKQQAYGIIAGSGENASTLHYGANNEPLKGRQLVCLDAGCEWKNYASDVTRTFPISGKWTKESKEIYDIVAEMQEECIAMCKPGGNYFAIHMRAHEVAIKGLSKLGLIHNGTMIEYYWAGVSRAFFPHGLVDYMGLEVHDVGRHGALLYGAEKGHCSDASKLYHDILREMLGSPEETQDLLEPGMVITVEPGIYFNKYALEEVYLKDQAIAKFINKDMLAKYYPVGGVRIEDDILITEDGYENLTTTPKGDEALKIINEWKESKDEKEALEDSVQIEVAERKKGWLW